MTSSATKITAGVGMPKTRLLPSWFSRFEFRVVVDPLVITRTMPYPAVMLASVTTKKFSLAMPMSTPLTSAPATNPKVSTTTIASAVGRPCSSIRSSCAPAIMAPTDRSMPPLITTTVIPTATTRSSAFVPSTLRMFDTSKKLWWVPPSTTTMAISASHAPALFMWVPFFISTVTPGSLRAAGRARRRPAAAGRSRR